MLKVSKWDYRAVPLVCSDTDTGLRLLAGGAATPTCPYVNFRYGNVSFTML